MRETEKNSSSKFPFVYFTKNHSNLRKYAAADVRNLCGKLYKQRRFSGYSRKFYFTYELIQFESIM